MGNSYTINEYLSFFSFTYYKTFEKSPEISENYFQGVTEKEVFVVKQSHKVLKFKWDQIICVPIFIFDWK